MKKICLLTVAGFITGTIVEPEKNENPTPQVETESKKIGFDLSIMRTLLDDFKIIDNASLIKLKDVTIFSTANPEQKIKIQHMIIFADQIIGFSLDD